VLITLVSTIADIYELHREETVCGSHYV